jgi:hypothetical protein
MVSESLSHGRCAIRLSLCSPVFFILGLAQLVDAHLVSLLDPGAPSSSSVFYPPHSDGAFSWS